MNDNSPTLFHNFKKAPRTEYMSVIERPDPHRSNLLEENPFITNIVINR